MEQKCAAPVKLAGQIKGMLAIRKPGTHEPLPSYQELSKRYGVSISTVQKAMDLLDESGVVHRMKRRGTFVRSESFAAAASVPATRLQCVNVLFHENWGGEVFRIGHAESLAGCSDALEHSRAKLRVVVPERPDACETLLSPVFPDAGQGCLLMHAFNQPKVIEWLRDRRIPFVVAAHKIYRSDHLPPHHSVAANKVKGAFDAAMHLLDLGHRRIGYIGTKRAGTSQFESEVYEGFRSALLYAGVHLADSDYMEFHTDEPERAADAVRTFLKRRPLPTAIMAQTDAIALALLDAARQAGLRVPGDLSVVGFNDLPASVEAVPPLTTVREPWRALARTATELLLRVAETPDAPFETLQLPCRLVVRQSTGPSPRTPGDESRP